MKAQAGSSTPSPAAGARSGGRVPMASRLAAMASVSTAAGCSRSPAQDIMGSFFPAWLLCLLIGIVAAVVARGLLIAVGLGEAIYAPVLAYPALALAVTFAVWLIRFGN